MTEELLQIYNPLNARRLNQKQIEDMQQMSIDDIKELAYKYPNGARGGAYLVLKDKSAKSQIFPLSTWANLYNLITKQGKKNYVPFDFRERFNKTTSKQPEIPLGKVQDLTKEEIYQAEGLRKFDDKIKAGKYPTYDEFYTALGETDALKKTDEKKFVNEYMPGFPQIEEVKEPAKRSHKKKVT